ncbi:hypothetical protein QTP86_010258 [Hemibagrus guttatus]|nr:hypothetical protein QTP86_010258 [Hemibagrus guttatus]
MAVVVNPGLDRSGPISLLAGKEYVVGRKNCDILLTNDQSISRVHALITVTEQAVTLKDSSKYGTFVNDKRLETASTKTVYAGDKITFGVFQSKFRLELDSVVVCSSCVDNEGKATLSKEVQALGGRLVNTWSQECTHLVMPAVKVTIKTICALLCCRPMVKPEFFTELSRAVQQREKLPKAESFRPEIDELILAKEKVDLGSRHERKTLFAGKTFFKRLSQAISFGGGRSQLLEEGSLPVSLLESTGTCVVDVTTGSSQSLIPPTTKKWADSIGSILHRNCLRFIAESEIGLAAIYVNNQTYCNPCSSLDSQSLKMRPAIPEATLSQNAAVDETVLHGASLNITAYVVNTEPSQGISRQREGSTDSELSEAKLSRQEDEESNSNQAPSLQKYSVSRSGSKIAPNQHDTTPRYGFSGSLGLGSGLTADSKSGGLQQNSSLNLDSVYSSKKRKEPEQDPVAPADLDVSLEELESIMSEDMDEPQPTANKKQCLDQGERSRAIAGKDRSDTFSKQRKAEKQQSIGGTRRNSEQETQSLANRDPVRMSRVTSSKTQASEREQSGLTRGNDRCKTLDVKEEEVSFVLETKGPIGFTKHSEETAVKEEPTASSSGSGPGKDPELPSKLLQVQFMSLTVRAPSRTRAEPLQSRDANGKNFKRFRKVPVPGLQGLPKIIGGSDLVAHNRSKNSELEEWLRDAAEQEKQQERELTLGDDLFRYDIVSLLFVIMVTLIFGIEETEGCTL